MDSDERKEQAYEDFQSGRVRVMITKPKIGAWGLNWQHCAHVVTFATHSYEQYYQAVRRCWRFGQSSPVTVDIIATSGESRVMDNMRRKAKSADDMFTRLINEMRHATTINQTRATHPTEVPSWL
jgi:SNF2 family DNA or RNA helicase